MKKRILSCLLGVVMFSMLISCIAVQAIDENVLLQKLKNVTSDTIVKTYYDDFDGDGETEMFALVGDTSGNVYFVSDSEVEIMPIEYFDASPESSTSNVTGKILNIKEKKIF